MSDIENLRNTILLSGSKIWGITSVNSGVGKTYISKLILNSLGEVGKKVLYLSLGNIQQEKNDKSPSHLESEISAIIKNEELHTKENQKMVVLRDSATRDKIVYDESFEKLVGIYKKTYDYVIVDMPALNENSVSKKLCTLCDENIIIVSKDSEEGPKVGKVINQLQKLDVKIAGIVINEYKTKKSLIRI